MLNVVLWLKIKFLLVSIKISVKGETSGVKKDFVCMDEEYERVDDLNKESTVNDEIIEADENDEDDDVMKEKAKGNLLYSIQ